MAKHDENGLFAMIDRLFRALMAMVWIAIAILVPLIASVRIAEAIRRRRASRDKYERAYWTSQIRLYVCTMYIAIAVYVQIMQDILLLPFSIDQRTVIMERVNTILGIPGVIWYAFIDRTTAMQGDPDKFFVASLSIAMIVWCYYFAKDRLAIHGTVGDDDRWAPSRRRSQKLREQYDAEEIEYRKWTRILVEHEKTNPRGNPAWRKWSLSEQERLMQAWQERTDELHRIRDACPRSSCFHE